MVERSAPSGRGQRSAEDDPGSEQLHPLMAVTPVEEDVSAPAQPSARLAALPLLFLLALAVYIGYCYLLLPPPVTASESQPPAVTLPTALPSLSPSTLSCTRHWQCGDALQLLFTADPFDSADPLQLQPPVDPLDGPYPAHYSPFNSSAAYQESNSSAWLRLLELCGNSDPEAGRWWSSALLSAAAVDSAPPGTPCVMYLDGRTTTSPEYETKTLAVLQEAVELLPASWRIHLWLRPHVLLRLSTLSPLIFVYLHLARKMVLHPILNGTGFDKDFYQVILLMPVLWNALHPASHVVVLESDSGLCPSPTRPITFFLEWDYCGAPWARAFCSTDQDAQTHCVGNSGFSVWRRSFMANITTEHFFNSTGNLDMQLRDFIDEVQPKNIATAAHGRVEVCPAAIGRMLSVESMYDGSYVPVGYHKPWFDVMGAEASTIFRQVCPSFRP